MRKVGKKHGLVLLFVLVVLFLFCGCSEYGTGSENARSSGNGEIVQVTEKRNPVQMEYLDRGTIAVMTDGGVYLSWRLLGTEDFDTVFSVCRNGAEIAKVSDTTNFLDPEGGFNDIYCIIPMADLKRDAGENNPSAEEEAVSVLPDSKIEIPLNVPAGGISMDGEVYTYSPNDATCADLDGDGEYEIILKWDPSNSFDSGLPARYTGNVYVDAYKLNGELLWRIDLGINISAGDHFTQLAAYDFDLDGNAELALKTAPGSIDGTGHFVSEASLDPNIRLADNLADYRSKGDSNERIRGKVLDGPEYLTVFEGITGKALDTVYYPFPRGSVTEWGDDKGNRSERYLTAVAYLDGIHPYLIAWRGYYAKTTAAAYRMEDLKLVLTNTFDSSKTGSGLFDGQGNHNLAVADVDGDAKDEILCGSLALDHDMSVLWCSGRGHGDALHLADYDPLHGGMEYFCVHENEPFGMTVYDAVTGMELLHIDGNHDTGRGMMAHAGYSDGYYEIWASYSHEVFSEEDYVGCYASYGIKDFREVGLLPGIGNFRIFWDGDLYDELLDGDGSEGSAVHIAGKDGMIAVFPDTRMINRTKQNVCLTADLFGDWREEFVVPSLDGSSLYIYMTTIPTQERLYTLMHDEAYRMQVAAQNAGYNQPPHLGYYICDGGNEYDARKDACYITTFHNGTRYIRKKNLPGTGRREEQFYGKAH